MSCRKYPDLNNERWLRNIYLIQGQSTVKIASLLGCKSANTVRQALIRAGITLRGFREGQVYQRLDTLVLDNDIIEGSLLGDGMLRIYRKDSHECAPYFKKRNKFKTHVDFVAAGLGVSDRVEREMHNHPLDKTRPKLEYWCLRTLSNPKLKPYFDRWYPAPNYIKVVPGDLILTPKMLLHWFMDDGSTWQRRPESRTFQLSVTLSCQSFTKSHQEFLCDQLWSLGVGAKITPIRDGTGWRIRIQQIFAKKFLELVGPPPVPELAYKWKTEPITMEFEQS